ncbi:zinc-ribbon domain-containing protein [Thermoproteota archaeon]
MSERKVDVFCTYCGTRIPENIIDCPNCGKPKN